MEPKNSKSSPTRQRLPNTGYYYRAQDAAAPKRNQKQRNQNPEGEGGRPTCWTRRSGAGGPGPSADLAIISRANVPSTVRYIPEHACGGSGNISVVELFRLATAQPSDCGLKLRSCCMKSEHSIRATSAKCRSHRIWFWNRMGNGYTQRYF